MKTTCTLDRRQKKIDEDNRNKILAAVYQIESTDTTRPYANITEISIATGLSRATVRKHLKNLKKCNMVLKVPGKGRASWYSSFYAVQAKGVYEDMLRYERRLNIFYNTPVKKLKLSKSILAKDEGIESARKRMSMSQEDLTLMLCGRGTDFETSLHSDLEWLNQIRIDYFSKTGRKRKALEKLVLMVPFLNKLSHLREDFEDLRNKWLILSWHPVCLRRFPELRHGILAIENVLYELVALTSIREFIRSWEGKEPSRFRNRALKGLDRCDKELASFLDMENVRKRLGNGNKIQDKNSIYNSGS